MTAPEQQLRWMQRALQLAEQAAAADEVPVGAVVVSQNRIVGEGSNRNLRDTDPSAHAEILALRQAAQTLGSQRLTGARLFVTLEPCVMCLGAAIHSRIDQLVFAAREPKTGAVVSQMELLGAPWHNHKVAWREMPGPCAEHSARLLQAFFAARR